MDLLFKRYASPFLLLDGMIETGRFLEFVLEFIDTTNEEKTYEFWLYKVFDKTYAEFKDIVMPKPVEKIDLETTVQESKDILNSFVPES